MGALRSSRLMPAVMLSPKHAIFRGCWPRAGAGRKPKKQAARAAIHHTGTRLPFFPSNPESRGEIPFFRGPLFVEHLILVRALQTNVDSAQEGRRMNYFSKNLPHSTCYAMEKFTT